MAKTILVLAANPKDTFRLRLDEEVREIDEGLQRAVWRDEFVLEQKWAVRSRDVRRAMLDLQPSIVHFCGHGGGDEGIAFEDETGLARSVDATTLAEFFGLFAKTVECVVLNACYSEVQAEAIVQHIDYVIGMRGGIADTAAIAFAVAFYDTLGAGKSIECAFEVARNAIKWESIPEHLTPILKSKKASASHFGRVPPPSNMCRSDPLTAAFRKLESDMPDLISEMRTDLSGKEGKFTREFFLLKKSWVFPYAGAPYFVYYYEDHESLDGKILVLKNHGFVIDETTGRAKKYRMTERFAELLLLTTDKAGRRKAPGDEAAGTTDAVAKFSYRCKKSEPELDEYLYELVVAVENRGTQTIDCFKLEFGFPDLSLFRQSWFQIAPAYDTEQERGRELVEIEPTDDAVSINRQGSIIHVIYQSKNPLFPKEEVSLTKSIGLTYRISSSTRPMRREMPPLDWHLYADDMPRQEGKIPFICLSNL